MGPEGREGRDEAEAALEARLTRVLEARLPGFEVLVSCDRLSGGASQETYRVTARTRDGERKLAMRRAPGGGRKFLDTGPGLAGEARLMQAAREAGVPEPEVLHVFEEADGLGDGFLMEWLEGETLGPRIVRGEEFAAIRPKLARQCGEILARVHSIDAAAAGLERFLQRKDTEDYVRELWKQYEAYDTPQPMIDYTARWLLEHLPPSSAPRLVHNDFRNGNLMIDPARGVVAVLDWEVAYLGDPMRDLGWLCTNSWRFGSDLPVGGFGQIDDLLAGYEAVSGRPVDRESLRFWTVFGSYWWAVGTLTMTSVYRSGLDRSVERAAIGRRTSECQVDCVNLLIPGLVEAPSPASAKSSLDMPRADELLESVRDFLRGPVMTETRGRTTFHARVAANAVDIVLRELELGPGHREQEKAGLEHILGTTGDLESLRWTLVRRLRDGSIPLDHPGLADHLRRTVVWQAAIDQPKYSGYRRALTGSGE